MSSDANTAISLGSPKEAAFYFDRVFPLDFAFPVICHSLVKLGKTGPIVDLGSLEIPITEGGFDEKVLQSLLPEGDLARRAYKDVFSVAACFWLLPMVAAAEQLEDGFEWAKDEGTKKTFEHAGFNYDDILRTVRHQRSFDLTEFVAKNIDKFEGPLLRAGLAKAPTWSGKFAFVTNGLAGVESKPLDYAMALHGLNLVDPNKVSWDAVIEFRKDKESLASLRDFRLFFRENFMGKGSSFVEDKLLSLIHEYEATTKFWGFETAKKTIAVAVSQQSVTSTAIGTLATGLTGVPLGIAAATGAIITLTSCALEFGQIFVDSRKGELVRPLRYLSRLKDVSSTNIE